MAQPEDTEPVASSPKGHGHAHNPTKQSFFPSNGTPDQPQTQQQKPQDDSWNGFLTQRRTPRKAIPGLPRTQTLKRQRSEVRSRLEPVRPSSAERRALSVDRRIRASTSAFDSAAASESEVTGRRQQQPFSTPTSPGPPPEWSGLATPAGSAPAQGGQGDNSDLESSRTDLRSETTSVWREQIHHELQTVWILNLSMSWRDKSNREKFFVTYRPPDDPHNWRRVSVTLDYRNAPEDSLERKLSVPGRTQREKNFMIYEAIRDSLPDIVWSETVTNLRLQTMEGRLHIHVCEDQNEIIRYPPVRLLRHLDRCKKLKEREIHFDCHLSGFVYKVRVHGRPLVKKEIPGPDVIDEFLYEINALYRLRHARNVIRFHGVVLDNEGQHVRGVLISYAAKGALIDILYDERERGAKIPWSRREKWARQIVAGLAEIHEAGFVQGDFTLTNIVVDERDDAKIIDINRRGCPMGWEPPELRTLIHAGQRVAMYIGIKSDLYQLGMVLWALAAGRDDPDEVLQAGRGLTFEGEDFADDNKVPDWFKRVVETCLAEDPAERVSAAQLLGWFPKLGEENSVRGNGGDHDNTPEGTPRVNGWAYMERNQQQQQQQQQQQDVAGDLRASADSLVARPLPYRTRQNRGRSPPSDLPTEEDEEDDGQTSRIGKWMMGAVWQAEGEGAELPPPAVPSLSDFLRPGGISGSPSRDASRGRSQGDGDDDSIPCRHPLSDNEDGIPIPQSRGKDANEGDLEPATPRRIDGFMAGRKFKSGTDRDSGKYVGQRGDKERRDEDDDTTSDEDMSSTSTTTQEHHRHKQRQWRGRGAALRGRRLKSEKVKDSMILHRKRQEKRRKRREENERAVEEDEDTESESSSGSSSNSAAAADDDDDDDGDDDRRSHHSRHSRHSNRSKSRSRSRSRSRSKSRSRHSKPKKHKANTKVKIKHPRYSADHTTSSPKSPKSPKSAKGNNNANAANVSIPQITESPILSKTPTTSSFVPPPRSAPIPAPAPTPPPLNFAVPAAPPVQASGGAGQEEVSLSGIGDGCAVGVSVAVITITIPHPIHTLIPMAITAEVLITPIIRITTMTSTSSSSSTALAGRTSNLNNTEANTSIPTGNITTKLRGYGLPKPWILIWRLGWGVGRGSINLLLCMSHISDIIANILDIIIIKGIWLVLGWDGGQEWDWEPEIIGGGS
ncbi:uncharacterized protein CTHT_0029510 [Thermochaetoides thermophila DSM 1495]|uniref:Protein kinase domain-containing protein n=1 Tax=Chaetomium thermophilum (strain DSM 1495 / CBS 144.50 / IMI 039719) TaxID=759272 RepID=G0S8D6_CHATD|nr:hypothetical protein CTHT_0029510 [Thermochaetoides thermophila DSM 1495]EGS21110.1 hypothetical protein CTHT_0029510 [Thermochaetoides thermophila DSM 1495]